MKIKVVGLKLTKEYEIEIPGSVEFIYGVETAGNIFCKTIGGNNIEYVAMLCLDNTNKIVNYSLVSIGKIENVHVSIPQIMKIALLSNTSKFIIAHNHPSGVLKITNKDIEMTKKIGALAAYFEMELIDSLVVNEREAVSIRERIGELKNEC